MKAQAGDRLVVEGHTDSEHRREAEVLEARGDGGAPPFMVRWTDGHEGLVYPGSDARVIPGDRAS